MPYLVGGGEVGEETGPRGHLARYGVDAEVHGGVVVTDYVVPQRAEGTLEPNEGVKYSQRFIQQPTQQVLHSECSATVSQRTA